MRTKEQIFEFIATELKNNNTIVVATLGNGGCGLTLLQGDCAKFIEELKTYGISWSNVIFYDHSNKLCFNYSDCYKKIPSDLINDFVCADILPEDINVVNDDKGIE